MMMCDLLGQQRFEGVEEFFLRAVLVGKELHVVDQQQIQRSGSVSLNSSKVLRW
jgi:hypothetical protein